VNPLELSGLQRMQGMIDGTLPRPSMVQTLPMRPVAVEPGRCTFTARADARHLNPMGSVHGGFAATLLDSATGCAIMSVLEAGASYGTVDLHLKFLRPVPQDVELTAEARVLQVTRNVGFAEGELRGPDGTLLAHATATCAIFRPRSEQAP
jgi:uncharacterized protein (TIGR00369 family)